MLLVFVAALSGGMLPGLAAGTPTYQQLMSFGTPGTSAVPAIPATGGNPESSLIQGTNGEFYGTAVNDGGNRFGTVFKLNPDGTGFTVLKNFDGSDEAWPYAGLIQGADGALYGTTMVGGSIGYGTVFKLNPDGTGFTVLLSLDNSTTGGYPLAPLMQGTDGALYGTAYQGGADGYGTVFKLNPDGTGFAVLQNFDNSTTGGYLHAGLIQGADGTLYGTANQGGADGYGTVFKLNPDGTGFTVLLNCDYFTTGRNPQAELIKGTDGALYGTAPMGGTADYGTVFKLNPDGTGFTILLNLDNSTTGGSPYAGLIKGADGALYGTASSGGTAGYGTVFKLNPDGTGFTVLQNFDSSTTGASPYAGLIQGADGALYGATLVGGSEAIGTIYKLNPDGSGFAVLKHLSYGSPEIPEGPPDITATGGYPSAGVIQGTDGILYGTTQSTVYRLAPDGTNFAVVLNLDYETTGAYPLTEMTQGADGALYGTTWVGGPFYGGTVFKVNRDGTGATVLKNFVDGDMGPETTEPFGFKSRLVQTEDGALYGTTLWGGTGINGTLFKLNPDGTDFSVLVNFESSTTGILPQAGLIRGMDGAFYGTTCVGGINRAGTVYKLNPDGSGFTVLKYLSEMGLRSSDHWVSELTQGSDGTLYGTASDLPVEGIGAEYLFKLNPDGSDFAILKTFDVPATGRNFFHGVIQATDGSLYGTAETGGAFNLGTVYRLNPDGSNFEVLLHFDGSAKGGFPYAGLMQGTDGALYGTTVGGGDFNFGTVFRLVFHSIHIDSLTPPSVPSGSGAFTLTVDGSGFADGAVVQWNGTNLSTTFISASQLTAEVTSVPVTNDIFTALITVRNPDGSPSDLAVFVVRAANVAAVVSDVAASGETVNVSTAPDGSGNAAGIAATLTNGGDPGPVTVTAAIYSSDPSPGTSFGIESATGVAGEFMDLQVTGADAADTMAANFYYPTDALESGTSPTLKYYDGAAWINVLSSGGAAPSKDMTDNLDGTVSGGRFGVSFDNTSTPKITELSGTFFAIVVPRPSLGFTGFLAPIGGADASGGSFANPLKTFKVGSTIPVKFKISRGSTAVVTGVHRLQAVKYSNETTAAAPIDATPQEAATAGNQFVLKGGEWHFNLDTRATGLTKGIWRLVATLSDGSTHFVWIQIK